MVGKRLDDAPDNMFYGHGLIFMPTFAFWSGKVCRVDVGIVSFVMMASPNFPNLIEGSDAPRWLGVSNG
ncbi:hypothetical protein EJ06DRAFT_527929 [Trichodelitschia bisporula]|uniref:Uncharacterized protein n=1 Tax=Trichodelitschia bisporula TaxID=703511 RepID=A0A6G1I3W6_9PEZI|nr:hypothetical protein EJ06DRAFT_527929 [Trichodelitschia bisporula]